MKHFFIYVNKYKDENMIIVKKTKDFLESRGCLCTVCILDVYSRKSISSEDEQKIFIPKEADCILVLGGDGTMLQAARDTLDSHIPLVGINKGTLGYLTEIEESTLEEALQKIIDGKFILENRMMITGDVIKKDGSKNSECALNDIVLSRTGSLQIIRFNIYVNGQFLNIYSADGMIVTTPTGSTGYNLSAGGPIVEPGANLMMLTPICSHSLNQRSIILSAEDEIVIEIPEDYEGKEQFVEVSFDGSHTIQLLKGDRIKIKRSEKSAVIMKLSQLSFLEILHKKMSES